MIITQTPFRMSFFGGGTDMESFFRENGGAVLSTTFDKYCYVNVRHLPRFFDYSTELSYSKTERVTCIEDIQHPAIRNAMKMLDMHEIRLTYEADLPARSGLGTSSSFAVGMLNAFYALKGKYADKKKLADEAIYLERNLCQEAGGWQDQIAASFGGFNRINFNADGYEVLPVIIAPERKKQLNKNLMMFFTGFTRFSSDVQKANAAGKVDKTAQLKEMLALVDEAEKVLVNKEQDLDDFGRMLDHTWKLKRQTGSAVSTNSIDELYANRKRNVFDVLYIFVLLYAFSTITQSMYSISLNRIWTVGIIACILYSLLQSADKRTVLCLGIILTIGAWTTASSENIGRNSNDYIYFATAALWLLFMTSSRRCQLFYAAAKRNSQLTNIILVISYVAVLIPLLTKSGFAYQWGSTPYFIGFAGTQHAMASSMCLITAVFLFFSLGKNFSWWNLAVLMFGAYIVLETGARTFIIPIAILVFYYIIVVDRDPRDVFLLNKYYWKNAGCPIPYSYDVKEFCTHYRKMRECEIKNSNDNVLRIHFEDLVYKYDDTLQKIFDFLHIEEEQHILKKTKFSPEKSIKNTQIYNRNSTFKDEADYIKINLSEYLYEFPFTECGKFSMKDIIL